MPKIFAAAVVAAPWLLPAAPLAQSAPASPAPARTDRLPPDWCKAFTPPEWKAALARSIEEGRVPPRSSRATSAPPVPARDRSPFLFGRVPCVTPAQIHVFEDPAVPQSLVLGEVFDLMTRAANDAIASHGDVFDFFGYFVSIDPSWGFATAFYLPIFNDVQGIGDPSGAGTPLFDERATMGLNSQRAQGFVMMHDLDAGFWAPGDGPAAVNTRLVLAHELGHRWICFLPPLLDGRELEGGPSCGVPGHWDWRIDSQASCLYLQEYVGTGPVTRDSTFGSIIDFNRDTGGAWAWLELYLMGLATPADVDLGSSELRYLDDACLDDDYAGPLSDFTAADVVASAGPRVPDAAGSQKDFRIAWVMLHPPGSPPSQRQLDDMAGIMQQQMLDWHTFSLGRSTLDVTLFDQCSDAQAYGCQNPVGSLQLVAGEPNLASRLVFEIDNPFGSQAPGALPVLSVSLAPDPAFPCGTVRPGWGMNGSGEILIDHYPGRKLTPSLFGPPWLGTGQPSPIALDVPRLPTLAGLELYVQGALLDTLPLGGVRVGLTDAVRVTLGP